MLKSCIYSNFNFWNFEIGTESLNSVTNKSSLKRRLIFVRLGQNRVGRANRLSSNFVMLGKLTCRTLVPDDGHHFISS